ncbi:MAG: hypothetical protein HUU57_13445, partial [Bdellovibrio sp.]|nr:hypothetical protein [Bdellovibrio sp.]
MRLFSAMILFMTFASLHVQADTAIPISAQSQQTYNEYYTVTENTLSEAPAISEASANFSYDLGVSQFIQ